MRYPWDDQAPTCERAQTYGCGGGTASVGTHPIGEARAVRGGSYYDAPEFLRISYRYGMTPQWGYGIIGFRCAR